MFFENKKVLIIGGTGTIGKSLISNILKENPKFIKVLSRDEYKQFLLQNEMMDCHNLKYLIGDVRNYDCVYSAMKGVDYVFHTAAMKHVSSCENNPYEATLTNITGTNNVIKAAISQKVKKVVFTSSDKAISPTNTYGATKLIAERLITSMDHSKGNGGTVFSSVRFGNIMGSRGSVIPLFKKQIVNNKKITVTNLEMSRFMMTLTQATNLTIKALKESKGGETFVLKMPVIRLKDLLSVVMEETCKEYQLDYGEIQIQEIGLRPGEKMYEELMTLDESISSLEFTDMFMIPSNLRNLDLYEGARKAPKQTYSSENQKSLSKEEVRQLLKSEGLI
ncbi:MULTISPECIES: polysaccharide biosynthesis protein [Priestia]|uniref:polysaccharide biosynthesis protein n=1 Tax=Priestia TaxID=2800373 RepID=UPI00077D803F|nr:MULTISPECIES: polysaccharide biosynthesis protein [Priestia]NGY80718.1 polysaccharide biosynthesis protein [Priestia megaterium]USL39503.1 polysaccharide biosynthesis protein [Priestia megaterium]WJX02538.1 polysaccharide biosynthesis protein [Priestia aryabhattai]